MKRSLLSTVLVLLVALLVGLFFWLRAPVQHEPASSTTPTAPSENERSTPSLATASQADELAREVVQAPAIEATAATANATRPAATLPPKYDKDARGTAHLIVQDRFGAPVANAEVRLTGLRSKREPASHWGVGEETQIGKSAADGTVALSFPVWLDVELEVGFLTLAIRHPEFVTRELDMFEVKDEPRVVVLERGAFLIVSGYIGSKENVVRDVVAHLTDEVAVAADSWLPIKDGRLSNATIPPGEHGLYLAHRATGGRLFYSDAVTFELAASEQKELHLELFPAVALEGIVDRAVPRPIQNGSVIANLSLGTRHGKLRAMRMFPAEIDPDGTFVLDGLPPGDGEIIGICDGWASRRVLHDDLDAAEVDASAAPSSVEAEFELQSFDTGRTDGAFELVMEPTATVVADVRDADGKPIAGATVSLWPNVRWRIGYSQIFMNRTYAGVSDAEGRAVIANLPAGRCWYGVTHERWEVPQDEQGSRSLSIELKSGEQSTITVRLQLRTGD